VRAGRLPMTDDYRQSLAYLYGRLDYERLGMPRTSADLRIGRMRRILRGLGDPQSGLRIIHVAGTKGKGSTAAMIAAVAGASGLRTGLFTSPHLHRVEERFRVDGRDVSEAELVDLVTQVRPVVDRLDRDDPHFREGGGATFFEITTAMGLLHFAGAKADLVVLEVGMGGRLDSTNAVRPMVSVITTISLDHTRLLGSTLAAIAAEKAGIIKRGRPAISGVRGHEAASVIARIAAQRHAPLRIIDRDYSYQYEPPRSPVIRPDPGRVRVETWRSDWGPVGLPLFGEHQALNASIALATLDAIEEQGVAIDHSAVGPAFANLNWPARVEILGERPWMVVDGAHNPASATALAETIRTCFPSGPRTLVFGSTREKDYRSQLEALLPHFDRVICTQYVNNPRALSPIEAAHAVVGLGYPPPEIDLDIASSLKVARALTPADGLICVTGSLFLAAEARAVLLGL
jgi:dihydrofolate synthase/folylpolyglutamate synthase